MPDKIAIILDCDGTVCDDTTEFLIRNLGLEPKKFWEECDALGLGWDIPLRYMYRLIQLSNGRKISRLTKNKLEEIGSKIPFYKGIPEFFDDMQEYVRKSGLQSILTLDFYVISGGIEDMIRASQIGGKSRTSGEPYLKDIIGCNFSYGPHGEIAYPKNIVTFTEKTRYIYTINKGISRDDFNKDPYRVNDWVDYEKRPVPLHFMIYIGDGPTDIPCLSAIRSREDDKGFGVGVGNWPEATYDRPKGRRIDAGPYKPDYRKNGEIQDKVKKRISTLAKEIQASRSGPPPRTGPRFG